MGLLSYLKPETGRPHAPQLDSAVVEMSETRTPTPGTAAPGRTTLGTATPGTAAPGRATPGTATPGTATPGTASPGTATPRTATPGTAGDMNEIKCHVMVNWLYQQQMEKLWTAGGIDEGVMLKKARNQYACCPADVADEPDGLFKAIQTLNVRVALTVNTRVVKLFLLNNERPYVPLPNGLRLQVLPRLSDLPRCQKHQFAAFIADRGLLVVWDDEPRHLLDRAQTIEKQLMEMIWGEQRSDSDENKEGSLTVAEVRSDTDSGIPEAGYQEPQRHIVLCQSFLCCFTLLLTLLCLGFGFKRVAIETIIDHNYTRLAFLLVVPLQMWLALFFFQSAVNNIAQLIGPISQVHHNTRFYSGVKPRRIRREAGGLPHVTIQMPVFKEGLTSVIEPTIRSVKAAISTYEMQGGTANIFINDDGMQLISAGDARARQDFYEENTIGWVARPKHNPKPAPGEDDKFVRRGKFKKASNMNYALWVSNRVEEKLNGLTRAATWNQEDEAAAYRDALAAVVEEDEGRTWADGNIRMGDYILLIDSDTRVPTDCFLDAVSEMEHGEQVAILQYTSGVMNVTDSYFEKGITFFTHLIYTAIKFAVANGDVAPFVGHNAVLRWSALQAIGYECALDEREKFWSEETVSEDFDMALRLQTAGYLVRFAAYQGTGFKEGVSLTVYDELARWEKYAYGCSELIFHPFRHWLFRGPFTPRFLRFLGSQMPLPSKLTTVAYIGTYYALGSAWIMTLANYFLTGWWGGGLDHYYLDSFKVYFAIIAVFSGLGNVSLAVLRYRLGEGGIVRCLAENFSWVPLLLIFLGGVSLHVSQAILCHMCGVDMKWGATSKEVEATTFFREIPKVVRTFRGTFVFVFAATAVMVVLATAAPYFWKIDAFIAIYPLAVVVLAHFLLPVALNPGLMRFTW